MVITAPKPLRDKLGEDGVDSLIELLNEVEKATRESSVLFVEEKFERRLSEEIAGVKTDFEEKIAEVKVEIARVEEKFERRLSEEIAGVKVEIAGVKAGLEEKIAYVKAELTKEIADVKAYLTRWMFIFWLGQVASVLGILALTGVFSR